MSLFAHWKFNWKDVQFEIPYGKGAFLDLGCGNGHFQHTVEKRGWMYIGCDVDALRGGAMVQCNGKYLPFRNNCIDSALVNQVLEHVDDPLKVLTEINAVLVQGGKIYGSVSCLEPFHDKCMYFGFTYKGIESILMKAGFANIELTSGINGFSLIMRNLVIRLLPKKLGEHVAFFLVKLGITVFIYSIFLCRAIISFCRYGKLSDDYKKAYENIHKKAPLDFAGHIQFIVTAR
ncbi:MAG: class I SAM-dependent methyltransferase [Candidatus Scalindua sp.]